MRKSLFPFIPFLLLVVPILEIGVFVLVGGQIGVINTLLGVVLTAFIGTVLLRQQGFALLGQAQRQMDQGKIPGKELAHGVMLLAAGLLLLTPGFVTDSVGFLLLVPPIREGIFAFFKQRITFAAMGGSSSDFGRHQTGGAQGTSYYSYRSYSSTSDTSRQAPSDPSIIDLDEGDFSEVDDREALRGPSDQTKKGDSPWGNS